MNIFLGSSTILSNYKNRSECDPVLTKIILLSNNWYISSQSGPIWHSLDLL